jgi:hypothetical protein
MDAIWRAAQLTGHRHIDHHYREQNPYRSRYYIFRLSGNDGTLTAVSGNGNLTNQMVGAGRCRRAVGVLTAVSVLPYLSYEKETRRQVIASRHPRPRDRCPGKRRQSCVRVQACRHRAALVGTRAAGAAARAWQEADLAPALELEIEALRPV